MKVGAIILKVIYKIFLPFQFISGNTLKGTDLTIKEFDINDIHIKLFLDESTDGQYLIAITNINEDGVHDLVEIANMKVGTSIQSFFDGISKALDNAAFFNIYNGDEFTVRYEMRCDGWGSDNAQPEKNIGFNIDNHILSNAIEFANSNNNYLKQAFLYLKEGEYLVEIGRYGNAIIQFAVMTEFLINYQLKFKKIIKKMETFMINIIKNAISYGVKMDTFLLQLKSIGMDFLSSILH